MRIATLMTGVLLALLIAVPASAQRQDLKVGSKAPGLDIEEWVKGNETTIQDGRVYVIEFWATWCGPCKRSIPHLTELQEKFERNDLTIIGVSDEKADVVKPYVQQMGDRMNYTVAVDRRNTTKRQWFQAAGLKGIPAAFIVDRKGIIQWIGNPLDDQFDKVLFQVVRGRYNARLYRQTKALREAIDRQRTLRNYSQSQQLLDELIGIDSHVFAPFAFDKFEIMLVDEGDRDAAYKYAEEMLVQFAGDAELLSDFAEYIAAGPELTDDQRDLDFALQAANVAALGYAADEPAAYAVKALVHYHRGELSDAIAQARKAYFVAEPEFKPQYESILRRYQQAARRASRIDG